MVLAVMPRPAEAGAGSVGVDLEPLYSPEQVAEYLQRDVTTIRRTFADRPGVVVLGRPEGRKKRSYTTLRIPLSVLKAYVAEHARCIRRGRSSPARSKVPIS